MCSSCICGWIPVLLTQWLCMNRVNFSNTVQPSLGLGGSPSQSGLLPSRNCLQVCYEDIHSPLLAASIFKLDKGICPQKEGCFPLALWKFMVILLSPKLFGKSYIEPSLSLAVWLIPQVPNGHTYLHLLHITPAHCFTLWTRKTYLWRLAYTVYPIQHI